MTVIHFPLNKPEPPVDLAQTIDAAGRAYCLGLLAATFGPAFAEALKRLQHARTAAEAVAIVAEFEAKLKAGQI